MISSSATYRESVRSLHLSKGSYRQDSETGTRVRGRRDLSNPVARKSYQGMRVKGLSPWLLSLARNLLKYRAYREGK